MKNPKPRLGRLAAALGLTVLLIFGGAPAALAAGDASPEDVHGAVRPSWCKWLAGHGSANVGIGGQADRRYECMSQQSDFEKKNGSGHDEDFSPKATKCVDWSQDAVSKTRLCTDSQQIFDWWNTHIPIADKVDFKCSAGDVFCVTMENVSSDVAKWSIASIGDLVDGSKLDSQSTYFSVASSEAAFWIGSMMALLALIFAAIAIAWGVIARSKDIVIRGVIGSVLFLPASLLAVFAMGWVLDAANAMTATLVQGNSTSSISSIIRSMTMPKDGLGDQVTNYERFPSFVTVLLLGLGVALMHIVDAFRTIGVMVGIALSPFLFAAISTPMGKAWVKNWAVAMLALVLLGPFEIGMLRVIVAGLASTKTLYSTAAIPFLLGLVLLGFAPFVLTGLFAWTGGVGQAAHGVGGSYQSIKEHGGRAQNSVRSVGRGVGQVGRMAGRATTGVTGAGGSALSSAGRAARGAVNRFRGAIPRGGQPNRPQPPERRPPQERPERPQPPGTSTDGQ